jgi:hypothetical protein
VQFSSDTALAASAVAMVKMTAFPLAVQECWWSGGKLETNMTISIHMFFPFLMGFIQHLTACMSLASSSPFICSVSIMLSSYLILSYLIFPFKHL